MKNVIKALHTYTRRIFPFESRFNHLISREARNDMMSYGFCSYLKNCYETKHGVPAVIRWGWDEDSPLTVVAAEDDVFG